MDSLLQYDIEPNRLTDDMSSTNSSTSSSSSSPPSSTTYTDPNNNNEYESTTTTTNATTQIKLDKYSLRPRSLRRVVATDAAVKAAAAAAATTALTTKQQQPRAHKPKQKPAPLSKYRRKTANARERNRMREINQAFETLRRVIPQMAATSHLLPGANEKLTKITTLRLAMKYISTLSAALTGPDVGNGPTATSAAAMLAATLSDCSDLDCLLLESDGESLPLSDHSSLLASPDFPDTSLSPVDFGDPTLPPFLSGDFSDHSLETSDFGDFLL